MMNDPGDWQPVGTNLWETRPLPVDVGNIIFNNGQCCGIKVWNRDDVNAPNKFCYDRQKKTVLLYATQNSGTLFDDIECALKHHIINQGGRSYVVYDGLHLAYGAAHGIGGGGTHYITVPNCDLCFNAGQGWSHAQRPWPAGVHLMFFSNSARTDKFFVRRNVFHGVQHSAINVDAARWNGLGGLVMSDNTYCQPPDTVLARWGEGSFTAAAFADYQKATQKDGDSHLVVLRSLKLEPATVLLRIGVSRQVRAVAEYSSGKTVDVTPLVRFASSDGSVATVTVRGLVRAEGPGKAEVIATINGSAATAAMVVGP